MNLVRFCAAVFCATATLLAQDAPGINLTPSAISLRTPLDRYFGEDGFEDPAPRPAPAKKPPILGDVPIVGGLFVKEERPYEALPPREAWFARKVAALGGRDVRTTFEEIRVRRYDADRPATETIRREASMLIAPEKRAAVEQGLDALAALRDRTVIVETMIVTRRPEKDEAVAASGAAEQTAVLKAEDFAARLLALRKGEVVDRNVLSAPRVLTRHGSPAKISVGNDVSYVKEYRLVVGDGSLVADPVVDVVHEGLALDIQPFLEPDGKSAFVRLQIEIASVARPVPAFTAKLYSSEVKTEAPRTAKQSFAAALLVPTDGGGVRVDGLRWTDPQDGRPVIAEIYLRASLAEAEAAKPKAAPSKVFVGTDGGESLVVLDIRDVRDQARFAGLKTGDRLTSYHEERAVGVFAVEHVADGVLLLRRVEGAPLRAEHELRKS
jgi:hypothetical protein